MTPPAETPKVTVRVPTTYRTLTRGHSTIVVRGHSLQEVLEQVFAHFPELGDAVVETDDSGAYSLHRFVQLFVRDEQVELKAGADIRLYEGDRILFLPAMGGG
jgi:molybdopterin converting factor small subunit